jgi:hypothetical protein
MGTGSEGRRRVTCQPATFLSHPWQIFNPSELCYLAPTSRF